MEENTVSRNLIEGRRIESIDVLRAFALLGILLVHGIDMFGCGMQDSLAMPVDVNLSKLIVLLFKGRATAVFNILFGVSFGIMMGKANYTSSKFVWRCFLLFLIGIVAKFFYWPDALMWYGVAGMMLAPVKKLNVWQIALLIPLLYFLTSVIMEMHLDKGLPQFFKGEYAARYDSDASICEAIALQPDGFLWNVKVMLRSGFFGVVAKFVIGYLVVRMGWIREMEKHLRLWHIAIVFGVYASSFYFVNRMDFDGYWMKNLYNLSGAFFYAMMVVWLYEQTFLRTFLSFFASYGKLGLTNYFMQGVVGVLVFCHFGVAFMHFRMLYIVMGMLVFYLLQAAFSHFWLQRFRNGPMEYIWRCAIERKWIKIVK